MNYTIYCNIDGYGRPVCAGEKNDETEANEVFVAIVDRIKMAKSLGDLGDVMLKKCTRVFMMYDSELICEEDVGDPIPEETDVTESQD